MARIDGFELIPDLPQPYGDDLFDAVCELYASGVNIAEITAASSLTHGTVEKILLTRGLRETELSSKIADMQARGLRKDQILDELKISKSLYHTNIPYSKGSYLLDTKSNFAIYIKKWREAKKEGKRNEKNNKR